VRPKRGRYNARTGLRELAASLRIRDGTAVEIGSYAGESALILAASGKLSRLTCIDPWNDRTGELHGIHEDFTIIEAAFDAAIAHEPIIRKLKAHSVDAAATFANHSLDLVYIDGAHDLDSVRADIRAWRPKLKTGGYMAGHDYFWRFPGVLQAVYEELGKPTRVYRDSSWLVPV